MTTIQYKADFNNLAWEQPLKGLRQKCLVQNNICLRLAEFSKEIPLDWCKNGHTGYVIEGTVELEFENSTVIYHKGDGIFIPESPEHKHRVRVISDKALIFFVEKP